MSAALTMPLLLAAAAGFADLDAIDRTVAAFTGSPIGAPGGSALPIDRRLRLDPCPAPLALSWRTARRDSVMVQCPAGAGWRLFVPVAGAAASAPAAAVIRRGDSVTIAVSGDGFAISQSGEAAEAGAVGDWIRVRTLRDSRGAPADTMRARILRPGLVSVELP